MDSSQEGANAFFSYRPHYGLGRPGGGRSGEKVVRPVPFQSAACPWYAPVVDFDAEWYFPENKTLRLMSRDAQMAVVAARLAMQDSGVTPDTLYPAEEIALFGATGLSGMPTEEIARLVRHSAAPRLPARLRPVRVAERGPGIRRAIDAQRRCFAAGGLVGRAAQQSYAS